MYALAIAFAGAMLLAWQSAILEPMQAEARVQAASDVAAANFWAYRAAAVNYVAANPGASGTIPDANLTFALGYLRNPAWTNVVSAGTLYTYSGAALPADTIDAVANRGGRTLVIGIAQPGGTMSSLTGGASGFVLPAGIPAGSLVVIGS